MRLIPWLEDGRIANNTRSVAAKRGTREVFSPTGSSRPGPNDLSPMNGPQPLAPCSSTGKQHQGFTGYGPRLTTATVSRAPWLAKPQVHTASGPPSAAQVLILILLFASLGTSRRKRIRSLTKPPTRRYLGCGRSPRCGEFQEIPQIALGVCD